jgi:hypothetical protein
VEWLTADSTAAKAISILGIINSAEKLVVKGIADDEFDH